MRSIFKTTVFTFLISILAFNFLNAQENKKFITASVGLGISAPYDDIDISGSGFYAQGEFVYKVKSWISARPYAGFIITSPSSITDENLKEFEVTTKTFFLGGKTRFTAPIPYVAPYIEFGIGANIGNLKTYTPFTNIKENGFSLHYPISLGLSVGKKHDFDIGLNYYYTPSAEQFYGAIAFGYSFPLDKKN